MSIRVRHLPETHEAAIRVFYYTVLVKDCTKPREGLPEEALLSSVERKLKVIAKTYGVGFSRKAAQVLVRTAVELGLLHPGYQWNANGFVINAITDSRTAIDFPARLAYLKYLLAGDGGTLVYLSKAMIREKGEIERAVFLNDGGWERVLREMCQEYLAIVLEPSERYRLRELQNRVTGKGYSPHTREHWFNPRAEAMVDLGIFDRKDAPITYGPVIDDGTDRVKEFARLFINAAALEQILSPTGDFFKRAAELYGLKCTSISAERDQAHTILRKRIVEAYEATRDDVYRLAHIAAIKDVVCIKLLEKEHLLAEWVDVENALKQMKELAEKDVHYHVDDWGKPSQVVISDEYVRRFV